MGFVGPGLPDLPQEDVDALVVSIGNNGLLEEITVAGDPPKVIDGKQREIACRRAGVPPKYRLLRGGIDRRTYVWAKNGVRRDLTQSQKALAAAELFPSPAPGRPHKHGRNSAI